MTLSMCNIRNLTLCICNMSKVTLIMCNMSKEAHPLSQLASVVRLPNPLAYQNQLRNLTSFTCSRQVPCLTCLWKSKWVGDPDYGENCLVEILIAVASH